MSKSDKSRKPRYTGYGRPVYHDHGSRRALVEQQSSRSMIAEQEEREPMADWELALLYASPVVSDERPIPNPFNIGMGFIAERPGPNAFRAEQSRMPTWDERERLAQEREAKRDAWIASARSERALYDLRERLGSVSAYARPSDPAKRITVAHRIRVTDVALMVGLTNVQTIYLLNTICKEYVPHANATVASIVATDLLKLVKDEEGGGRMFVTKILSENGMGDIDG